MFASAVRWASLKNRFEKLEQPDTFRIESTLAAARAFLSVCSFFAIFIDPFEPTRFANLATTLLLAHVAYSVAIVTYLGSTKATSSKLMPFMHSADMIWALLLTLFSRGPTSSPFFAFFIFAIVAAAYRWHLRETMTTTAILIMILCAESFLVSSTPRLFGPVEAIELNRLIVRAAYLIVVGVLLGYLSGKEKQHRTEIALVSDIGRSIRSELGLTRAVHVTIESLLHVYDAGEVWLLMMDHRGGQMMLWRGCRVNGDNVKVETSESELPADLNALLPRPSGFNASFLFRDQWSANVYVFEPSTAIPFADGKSFIEAAVNQIGSAIYSVFLGDLLRSRAGALERARLARELHDGVIQSLVGAEMRVAVLRRNVERGESLAKEDLRDLQELLHNEVLSLRELMQQMKPPEVGPEDLLDFIADRVDRFRRDTGISTKFHTELHEVSLPSAICQELARIVQELLTNIRKHSGARNGLVRFGRYRGIWKLTIEDDGQGFPFKGRWTLPELDKTHQGPLTVKERIRAIGGELVLESMPGKGSRLEISFSAKENDRKFEAYSHTHR
jgi:signal transduction histidine kinase